MAQQPFDPISIPINKGTVPDWETRLGYPQIFNLFVGPSGFLYSTAGLDTFALINNCRAIHYTTFNGGSYIAVTNTSIARVSLNGQVVSNLTTISNTQLPVQITENAAYQITIVDGRTTYVINQSGSNPNQVLILEEAQGYDLQTPCAVTAVNNLTCILDTITRSFIVSDPNNALNYDPLQRATIASQLNTPLSLEALNDNLYIFGSAGIERWEPSLNVNTFIFPFSKDNNFRKDYGAIGTNAVILAREVIYFLSSEFVPMALSEGSAIELKSPEGESTVGMSRIISQYPDVADCTVSFYSFRGQYFGHFTFPETGIAWVFNQNSGKWSLSDDLILGAAKTTETVMTQSGFYTLSLTPSDKRRTFISERVVNYKGQEPFRNLLSGVEVRMVQGNLQQNPNGTLIQPQFLELTLSIDSMSWLNTVRAPIGPTGARNAITLWRTNLAAYEYTTKIEYFGTLDLVIERVTAYIN